jgi:hypothetical protein
MSFEIRPHSVTLAPSQAYTIYPQPYAPYVFAPQMVEVIVFLLILLPLMLMPIFLFKTLAK